MTWLRVRRESELCNYEVRTTLWAWPSAAPWIDGLLAARAAETDARVLRFRSTVPLQAPRRTPRGTLGIATTVTCPMFMCTLVLVHLLARHARTVRFSSTLARWRAEEDSATRSAMALSDESHARAVPDQLEECNA